MTNETLISSKKRRILLNDLQSHLVRKKELAIKLKEPIPKILQKKEVKFFRDIKGIQMITSRKSITSKFVTQKDIVDDNITVDSKCDICGKYIRIYIKDADDWVICDKPSCELVKFGDDVPIITEDDVLHYKGVILTTNDLIYN